MITLLQIVFNEAENKKGISSDAWFLGLTPIVIFILGYIINKKLDNRKENKRLIELKNFLKTSIELLRKPLNEQKKGLIELSHILKAKKDMHLYLKDVTDFHAEQFKEIHDKDLYTIFISNKEGNISKKTELYGKLLGSIAFIKRTKEFMIKDFLILREKYEKYQNDYNKSMETIDNAFRLMISQTPLISQDLFMLNMYRIREAWAQPSTRIERDIRYADRYIAKERFIDPLKRLCEHHIMDQRAGFILNQLMSCIYAFYNIEELKMVYRRHFLLDARGLQKSWFNIDNSVKEFELMSDK